VTLQQAGKVIGTEAHVEAQPNIFVAVSHFSGPASGKHKAGRKLWCRTGVFDALNPKVLHNMATATVGQQEACLNFDWPQCLASNQVDDRRRFQIALECDSAPYVGVSSDTSRLF
jgi:hypothetical protein